MVDSPSTPPPSDARGWADLLQRNWSERARSEARDFYVASHPGWQDPARWAQQARIDVDLLCHGLDPDWLQHAAVLEVGCGVGRLVPALGARTATYTGFDVAAEMVVEARRRVGESGRVRFFTSSGSSVPEAAADRRYDLAVALAVFVHCPRVVIEALTRDVVGLLRPGGRFRFQILADEHDPSPIAAPPADVAVAHEDMRAMEAAATPADLSLIEDRYYMGHRFGLSEADAMFRKVAAGGEVELHRLDLHHVYGEVRRA